MATTNDGIHIKAPQGMSYVNAAYALWLEAGSPGLAAMNPKKPMTTDFIVDHFKAIFQDKHCTQTQLDYMNEKQIKVFFDDYPTLIISTHDAEYGDGHAAMALKEYSKVPPNERLDKNDQHTFETDKVNALTKV